MNAKDLSEALKAPKGERVILVLSWPNGRGPYPSGQKAQVLVFDGSEEGPEPKDAWMDAVDAAFEAIDGAASDGFGAGVVLALMSAENANGPYWGDYTESMKHSVNRRFEEESAKHQMEHLAKQVNRPGMASNAWEGGIRDVLTFVRYFSFMHHRFPTVFGKGDVYAVTWARRFADRTEWSNADAESEKILEKIREQGDRPQMTTLEVVS